MAVNTLAYLSQAQPYDVGPKTPSILETLSAGEGYQQKKQATKLGQKTLRDYDEDRRLKLEKATREETEAKAKALRDAQDWQQDFKKKVYDNASRQIPQLNLGNLKYFYEEYSKLGFGEETLPPFESIKTEEDVKKLQAVLTEKLRQGREMLEKDTDDVAQRRRYDRAIESGEFSGSLFDFAAQERAYETEGAYKVGTIKDFKVGEEIVQHEWTGTEWEPTGIKGPRYKPGVTVNVDTSLTRKVQADLQTTIIESEERIAKIDESTKLFKREYLEYAGRGKAWLSEKMDKFGSDWGSDFMEGYSPWKTTVDQETLLFRKFITGVAGGEREMKTIEKVYINTKSDSPTMFLSKAKQMKKMWQEGIKRAEYSLKHFGREFKDLTPEQKAEIQQQVPLTETSTATTAEDYLKAKGL